MNSNDIPARSGQELIEWLRERYDNCIRIAAQKTGEERDGWLEDAAYFNAAICALASKSSAERTCKACDNTGREFIEKKTEAGDYDTTFRSPCSVCGRQPSPAADCAFVQVTGGLCYAHGEYQGTKCPQWPLCAIDPPVFQSSPAAAETPKEICAGCQNPIPVGYTEAYYPAKNQHYHLQCAPGKAPIPEEPPHVCDSHCAHYCAAASPKPEGPPEPPSLKKDIEALRSIPGKWKEHSDPLAELDEIRNGGPHTENQPPAWANLQYDASTGEFKQPSEPPSSAAPEAQGVLHMGVSVIVPLKRYKDLVSQSEIIRLQTSRMADTEDFLVEIAKIAGINSDLFEQDELLSALKDKLAAHPPAVPRCPKCQSKNIDVTYSSDDYALAQCRECQHQLGGKLVAQFFTRQDSPQASATAQEEK